MESAAQKVAIQLNGEFSAHELEEIIHRLAIARAGLAPPVPMQPPHESAETQALEQASAKFSVRTLAQGGLRIWLRNEGIGWQAFTLDAAAKEGLANFLGQQLSHTHTSH